MLNQRSPQVQADLYRYSSQPEQSNLMYSHSLTIGQHLERLDYQLYHQVRGREPYNIREEYQQGLLG